MKFWMTGLFGAMVAGGVWTVLWHVIISILAVLMWGIPVSLQISSTLIAGMLAGAFVVWLMGWFEQKRRLLADINTAIGELAGLSSVLKRKRKGNWIGWERQHTCSQASSEHGSYPTNTQKE